METVPISLWLLAGLAGIHSPPIRLKALPPDVEIGRESLNVVDIWAIR